MVWNLFLFIAFLLVLATLFCTPRNNLLHAIQLTTLTGRLSVLYLLLIFFQWSDYDSLPTNKWFLLFIPIFLIQMLQQTYVNQIFVSDLVFLFFPNLIFFILLDYHIIYFCHFTTLLFVLQCAVIFFFWFSILLGTRSEEGETIKMICKNPFLLFDWKFASSVISHFAYNAIILYHTWSHNYLCWNITSWTICQMCLFVYAWIILANYIVNRNLSIACFDFCPISFTTEHRDTEHLCCKSNPVFISDMLESRMWIFRHYHSWHSGASWNKRRVRYLLKNVFYDSEIKTFITGIDLPSDEFIEWILKNVCIYRIGFIYLSGIFPYDILYCDQKRDGPILAFWKPTIIFLMMITFINVIFLFAVCFL